MSTELATTVTSTAIAPIINLVLDTVSERSQRDYGRALRDFIAWHVDTRQAGLTKATVQAHIAALKARGVTESSINQRLAAIRKLANEAADNELIPEAAAQAINRIKNIERKGSRSGNWLLAEQAGAMLNKPDTSTLKGLRDRAILAVMLGAGLRREEVAGLTVEHLQLREARWVILDLVGKHNRIRTVPIASWIKATIDKWTDAAGHTSGPLFRPVHKGGRLRPVRMTAQAIWHVVDEYAPVAGLAPHDLRRTFAKLADKGGAPLDQIQQVLGHASVQTTERYVGRQLNLVKSPSDYIEFELG